MVNVKYNDGSARNQLDNRKDDDSNATSKIFDPNDNPPPVLVEPDKIRILQVISNLLTNAIKFTRGAKVAIIIDNNNDRIGARNDKRGEKREGEVKLEGHAGREEAVVSFRDSRTGIDPEIIDKIFEKFVTKSDKELDIVYLSLEK
jgi:two-component system, OmpR family, sensor histidine kinase VicK